MKKFKAYFILLIPLLFNSCGQAKKITYSDTIVSKQIQLNQSMPIIVIDPGHGNFDLGTHNEFCEEKVLALNTSLYVKTELVKKGYRVVMTRSHDEFVPLKKRAQIANDMKSQVLVSIHYNAAHNKEAHGIEIFYPKTAKSWKLKRSKMLAQSILRKMLTNTNAFSRGIKAGNLCVIRETDMPAVLVECGFITNAEECKKMLNPEYQKLLARSIAEGLDEYFQM